MTAVAAPNGDANRHGPVVLFMGEGQQDVKTQRIPAALKQLGYDPTATGLPIYVVDTVPLARDAETEAEEMVKCINQRLGDEKPVLIGIDTYARAMIGAKISDAGEVARFVHIRDTLTREFGCTVVTLAHPPLGDMERTAGASTVDDTADQIFKLKGNIKDLAIMLENVRTKSKGALDPIHLEGQIIDVPKGSSIAFHRVAKPSKAVTPGNHVDSRIIQKQRQHQEQSRAMELRLGIMGLQEIVWVASRGQSAGSMHESTLSRRYSSSFSP